MKKNLPAFFLAILVAAARARAQQPALEFVENKGQWDKSVLYVAQVPNGQMTLGAGGFSMSLTDAADMSRVLETLHGHGNSGKATSAKTGSAVTRFVVHSHAYRVDFVGANIRPEIVADKPLDTYNNYFIGNDSSKWASRCRIFQAVTYRNVYPGIDLRYYTEEGTLKYDMVIHPGADPQRIAMKYTGATRLQLRNNELVTQTTVGSVRQRIPHTFSFDQNGRSEIECRFSIGKDSTVRFNLGSYDRSKTVIVDPTLVFSTFTGSRSDNWGYTATYDAGGNFYAGSIVVANPAGNGFPVSPGAVQRVFGGGDNSDGGWRYDIGIMKFSPDGRRRVYSTYLGGTGNEQPHSLVVDAGGNLIIAGRTSSPDYPQYPVAGAVNRAGRSDYDILITKLNADGTAFVGSSVIGGSGDDGVNIAPKYSTNPIPMGQHSLRLNYGDDGRSEVVVDEAGNIYLASCTQSTDFPTVRAFQASRGGAQDGVFLKLAPDARTVLAASYLGGSGDDAAFALALNPTNGNVYVGGATASTNLPGALASGFSANNGGIDGFLTVISPDGGTRVTTAYIGTSGTDAVYGVQFDKESNPYVMGTTTGSWPVINASFSQANGKQFFGKLKTDLSGWQYSSVFGKGAAYPDISPTAFLVDRCDNVYIAGWGGGIESEGEENGGVAVYNNSGTDGLTTTGDAIKPTTDGADFYFIVIKRDASGLLYATFFGENGGLGDHVDGGTSRFDRQGVIYEAICANCSGGVFPTTPGVWSPRNPSGLCNLAAVKIAFNFAGVAAELHPLINGVADSSGCIPLTVTLADTVKNAKRYWWSYGDGTRGDTTTAASVTHIYTAIGTYRARVIAVDSTTCNITDTAYVTIRARNDQAFLNFSVQKLAPCQSLAYRFTNLSTYASTAGPFKANSFQWDFGDGTPRFTAGPGNVTHSYAASGSYTVKLILIDTSYCNAPDSTTLTLSVAAIVKARFETPDSGCAPYHATFTNTSVAGMQFYWDFGDGTTGDLVNETHDYPNPGTYRIQLIAVDSNTCNIADTAYATIQVFVRPTAEFSAQPTPPQVNTPTIFTNQSSGAVAAQWLFGDGATAFRNNLDTVIHQYQRTGTFNACLIAYNQFGCTDTVCHPVEALINPLLDVPNAFTPGRGGTNAIIQVRGFGIAAMIWRIYNRWGQLVFESNDPNVGWDGNARGVPQPMDVYAYTLNVTYFDGTKTTRKGDITLIR